MMTVNQQEVSEEHIDGMIFPLDQSLHLFSEHDQESTQ